MPRPLRFSLASLVLVLASCGSTDADDEDPLRVLFVGNSLTYTNNLPAIVERMAEIGSDRPLEYRMIAFPNFSLEDHWGDGEARNALEEGDWDFIVMQQGPSSLPGNQVLLRSWVDRFADASRAHGCEPAIFTVWPSEDRSFAFDDVITGYESAAEAVDGLLLPAGEAWVLAWEEDPDLGLYGPDNFHPSPMGSYLAGLVIYAGLFDASPRDIPDTIRLSDGATIELPSITARILKEAAVEALR